MELSERVKVRMAGALAAPTVKRATLVETPTPLVPNGSKIVLFQKIGV